MQLTYNQFRIFIHLLLAFVFLADVLVDNIPTKLYEFLKRNKDLVLGVYYLYLAYELYSSIDIITPMRTPIGTPINIRP
jgi:hypothetical protein